MKKTISLFICLLLLSNYITQPAKAGCGVCSTVIFEAEDAWIETKRDLFQHFQRTFEDHKKWIKEKIWEDRLEPSLDAMSAQLTTVGMQQVQIFGTFLDAKHQLETQRTLQTIRARAHKDYQPSDGMCTFGTAAKSLAASERKSELAALHLSRRAQDRALRKAGSVAAQGDSTEKRSRIQQFREKFCNPADHNNGLAAMCAHDERDNNSDIGAKDPQRMNKDIDYARTIDAPWTLELDFSDTTLSDNEEEVMALGANLYGSDSITQIPPERLQVGGNNADPKAIELYMDTRATLAKRSVAQNSYHAITAMKAEGSEGSKDYLKAILEELGVANISDNPEAEKMLGERPSYYAQMEVLTKKIYQSPDFYTNLYDKPANVARKEVALQAIGLMQKFDLFKSYLRNEASLSVLLELAVMDLQDTAEGQESPVSNSTPLFRKTGN